MLEMLSSNTSVDFVFTASTDPKRVFPLMRFLIFEIAKSHMERYLANKGGVATLAFDFWPETA